MKTNYLFPYQMKTKGWILLISGLIFGVFFLMYQSGPNFLNVTVFSIAEQAIFDDCRFFTLTENNIFDEIIGLLLIIGASLIAFSKEKNEDEFISKIRLESLVWAIYLNYAVLILTLIFIYKMIFFWVLVFNMFTILFFFIIRFNWVLMKSKKQIRDEE